jgi:CRISPR-associated endonuclease/helicase Cas3
MGRSRYIYAPYVLVRTFDNWIGRPSVTLPSDIRIILEATYSDSGPDAPEGWNQLRRELQERCDRLRNTAINASLVMRQPDLPDDEGVQTRINDIPTAHVLLVTAEPLESPRGRISLRFPDGEVALVWKFRFDLEAARIIHRNVVRIPALGLEGMRYSTPSWLSEIVPHNAVLGVVGDAGAIYINQTDSSMTWHRDEGVVLPTGDTH